MSISHSISNLSQRQINIIRALFVPVEYVIQFLDLIYPKNDKLIIFGSNTGEYASGSPHAMYQYIKNNHPEYGVCYYLPFSEKSGLKEQFGYMLRLIPKFLNAKFLISSHPTTDFFPLGWSRRKTLINVWHGVPLKSLFYADPGDNESNLKKIRKMVNRTSIFTVSSKLESALIAECMLMDPRKIRVTGHPRNDALINQNDVPGKKKIHQILKDIPQDVKIILYAPTFRRGDETRFFPFPDFDQDDLNQFLKDNNSIILIRGHVYNQLDESTDIFTDRIIDFGFNVCNDVNSILGEVDVLITDYSSIYIDYLILNRPCIFIPYDLEDYKKGRGLLLDDYDFWAPGDKTLNYQEFLNSLKRIMNGEDPNIKKRIDIANQFHYYTDAKSCERLFKLIR